MKFPSAFFQRRAPLLGFVALLATVSHWSLPKPPERSLSGVAQLLGNAIGGVVKPEELIWEPSPGVIEELLLGRRVLFLGRTLACSARDLYRARVRVTLERTTVVRGHAAQRHRHARRGRRRARSTRQSRHLRDLAFGRIQGLSVLDLSGIPRSDRPERAIDRVLLAINSYQNTGSFAGLGRTNIVLEQPAESAKLTLDPPQSRDRFRRSRARSLLSNRPALAARSGRRRADRSARRARSARAKTAPFVVGRYGARRSRAGADCLARKQGFWPKR